MAGLDPAIHVFLSSETEGRRGSPRQARWWRLKRGNSLDCFASLAM